MNVRTVVVALVALVVGGVAGYLINGSSPATAEEAAAPAKAHGRAALPEAKDAEAQALMARIKALERQLAAALKDMDSARPVKQDAEGDKPAAESGERRHESPRERLEALKKSDPARYAEVTNRMARFRQFRARRAQNRSEFLASVETSGMTAAERKNHENLQGLIAKREELEEKMHDEDLSEEDRRKLFEEMRATDRQMREANRTERKALLKETAEAVGLTGDDVTAVVDTIGDVIEATESGHGMPPGPPPGGNGAPPPGP